jgi:ribonuclease HI
MSTKFSISRMGYNTWSEPKRGRTFQRRKQRRIPTTRWISAATQNLWSTFPAGTRRLPAWSWSPRRMRRKSTTERRKRRCQVTRKSEHRWEIRWEKGHELSDTVLTDADLDLSVCGSAYIDQTTGKKHGGFGIVTIDRTTHIQQPLPDTFSAQQAEPLALTTACKTGEGKRVTIFSDSAYAIGVCLSWCGVWRSRGFHNACGIHNRTMVLDLLGAMMLYSALAIVKVAAHTGGKIL